VGRVAAWRCFAVISRMREICLSGVKLLSDRQPAKLRVDDHTSGLPHIWLHDENPDTTWIVVDIGALDWCKLSYQFARRNLDRGRNETKAGPAQRQLSL
jgi:hypothetical protein